MPKPPTFTPAEISALGDRLREGWRPGSQITPWLRDDAERLTKLNREERFSWAAVASASTLNEVGIMYCTSNPWTATNLAKVISEVRPGGRANPTAERRAEPAAWKAEQDAAKAEEDATFGWQFGPKDGEQTQTRNDGFVKSDMFRFAQPILRRTSVGNENGFTLLELLVAIVILGLCVAVLTNDISDSLARAQRVETDNSAAAMANAMLAALGRDVPLVAGVTRGKDRDFAWQMVVAPAPGYQDKMPLEEIDLTMFTLSHHVIGHWQTLRLTGQ